MKKTQKKIFLSKKDIIHIAKLANLKLSPAEIEKFRRQLSEVIGYINKLNELETGGIDPVTQTTGLVNVSQEDAVETSRLLTQEKVLRNVSFKKNGLIKIKAIFK